MNKTIELIIIIVMTLVLGGITGYFLYLVYKTIGFFSMEKDDE